MRAAVNLWLAFLIGLGTASLYFWNSSLPIDNLKQLHDEDVELHALANRLLAAHSPVFDWRDAPPHMFALKNGEVHEWTFKSGKFRFHFEAQSPITFAAGNAAELKSQIVMPIVEGIDKPRLRPTISSCASSRVLQTDVTCELSDGDSMMVQDDRGLTEEEMGTLTTVLNRNANTLSAATGNNTVKMSFAVWACVRNCPLN